MPQLALKLETRPRYAEADLLANPGQALARAWLERTAEWPQLRLVLWGAAGSGKTHLVHAWAERVGGVVLRQAPRAWPETPAAIDSLDDIADEAALLHLLNAAAEARRPLLLATTEPPARLPLRLPDLASRLRAAQCVEIGRASDDFLALLFARLLAERQLPVPEAVRTWLLTRLPRSPAAICAAAEQLDAAALAAHRPVGRAMAARVLGFHDSSDKPSPPAPGVV